MPLVFEVVFSTSVITWIESIGSEKFGGGWGALGGLKQTFKLKGQCFAISK